MIKEALFGALVAAVILGSLFSIGYALMKLFGFL